MTMRRKRFVRLFMFMSFLVIVFVLLNSPMISDFKDTKLYQMFLMRHTNDTDLLLEADIHIGIKQKIFEETYSNDEWLDRTNSRIFRRYSNASDCPGNPYRQELREILRHWMDLAKKLNIRYFLSEGSLLGAWRDGDIIPYDFDMDIRVHVDDLPKLYPLRQKRKRWSPYKDPGYHIYFTPDWRQPYLTRRRFACSGELAGIYQGECSFTDPPARLINHDKHIDIFIYHTFENVLQFFPSSPAEFSKSEVLPLVKCKFLDETTWCPRNPKHILDELYELKLTPSKICENKKWVEKN